MLATIHNSLSHRDPNVLTRNGLGNTKEGESGDTADDVSVSKQHGQRGSED